MQSLDIVILGLVSIKPRHGYDILKEMQDRGMRNLMKVSDVAIYKALYRLEREGYLSSFKEKEGKSPERNVFSITQTGENYLQDIVFEYLSSDEPLRNEYLAVFDFLLFLNQNECLLGLEERIKKLKRIRQNLQTRLSALKDIQSYLSYEVIKHQCDIYDLEIKWLEKLVARISKESSLDFLYKA